MNICCAYPGLKEELTRIVEKSDTILTERQETAALMRKLKDRGYTLLYLSDTNESNLNYIREHCESFSLLEGGIASYLYRVVKPEREIYELLLAHYGKSAEECLFIDDNPGNTAAAERLGFQVITLTEEKSVAEEAERMLGIRF